MNDRDALLATAPKGFAVHYIVEPSDYDRAIDQGRRFFTVNGNELKSSRAVAAALKRDGSVESQ
jgi:hypothetical protein